jgi:hypothetical protein
MPALSHFFSYHSIQPMAMLLKTKIEEAADAADAAAADAAREKSSGLVNVGGGADGTVAASASAEMGVKDGVVKAGATEWCPHVDCTLSTVGFADEAAVTAHHIIEHGNCE